jgi:hypothetical protein
MSFRAEKERNNSHRSIAAEALSENRINGEQSLSGQARIRPWPSAATRLSGNSTGIARAGSSV